MEMPGDIEAKAWAVLCKQSCNSDVCSFKRGCGCFDAVAAALMAERMKERQRCAQILVDHFAPNQGEDMHPSAINALRAIRA